MESLELGQGLAIFPGIYRDLTDDCWCLTELFVQVPALYFIARLGALPTAQRCALVFVVVYLNVCVGAPRWCPIVCGSIFQCLCRSTEVISQPVLCLKVSSLFSVSGLFVWLVHARLLVRAALPVPYAGTARAVSVICCRFGGSVSSEQPHAVRRWRVCPASPTICSRRAGRSWPVGHGSAAAGRSVPVRRRRVSGFRSMNG